MDKLGCGPATRSIILRKNKKKNAKGEIDRVKQAEKKKRRLEKALATSAAIRSELEKKKQKKMEEQQRLDEEGAAIAESVALLVLGGEDSDHHDNTNLNGCRDIDLLDDTVIVAHPVAYPCLKMCSSDGLRKFSSGYRSGVEWNNQAIGWQLHAEMNILHPQIPYITGSEAHQVLTGMSASSIFEFDEDSHSGAHYLLNQIMNAGHLGKEVRSYQEY